MIRLLAAVSILAGALPSPAGAATYETLYTFAKDPVGFDGLANPAAPLLMNAAGTVIYGNLGGSTSTGLGHPGVYTLTPPKTGALWTKTTIFTYPEDDDSGCYPTPGLVSDTQGNLFGTVQGCYGSGDDGSVVEISPPKHGGTAWTGRLIHHFHPWNSTENPQPGLVIDGAGNLYGGAVSINAGAQGIYELIPPATGTAWSGRWLATLLPAAFDEQSFWLLRDAAGNLYGEGEGNGDTTVGDIYRLSPPPAGGTRWGLSVLATLPTAGSDPDGAGLRGGLVMDRAGNLYSTAGLADQNEHGTVFELSPPTSAQQQWTVRVLHTFNGADGQAPVGLTLDGNGKLYGVAPWGGAGWKPGEEIGGEGVIYKLSPPAKAGAAWTFTILHAPKLAFFNTASGSSALNPRLILGPDHALYGTANGPAGSGGSVFRVTP